LGHILETRELERVYPDKFAAARLAVGLMGGMLAIPRQLSAVENKPSSRYQVGDILLSVISGKSHSYPQGEYHAARVVSPVFFFFWGVFFFSFPKRLLLWLECRN
jgi:hypothetical protein